MEFKFINTEKIYFHLQQNGKCKPKIIKYFLRKNISIFIWDREDFFEGFIDKDFSEDCEAIGIKNVKDLIEEQQSVTSERKAMIENIININKIVHYFIQSCDAFQIIQKKSSPKPFEISKYNYIINLCSNARLEINQAIELYKLSEKIEIIKETKEREIEYNKTLVRNRSTISINPNQTNSSSFVKIQNKRLSGEELDFLVKKSLKKIYSNQSDIFAQGNNLKSK